MSFLFSVPLVAAAQQRNFATPEEAVDALIAALKADDDAALIAIFGDKYKNLIATPDRAVNSATRAKTRGGDANVSCARRSRALIVACC